MLCSQFIVWKITLYIYEIDVLRIKFPEKFNYRSVILFEDCVRTFIKILYSIKVRHCLSKRKSF